MADVSKKYKTSTPEIKPLVENSEGVASREFPKEAPEVSTSVEAAEDVSASRTGETEGMSEPVAPSAAVASVPRVAPVKDPLTQSLEKILEEDLAEVYKDMSLDRQEAFRVRGEEVTTTIRAMLDSGKLAVRKILLLIRGWLHMIPGVNKFFLEQEAKIKTDKIIALHDISTHRDT